MSTQTSDSLQAFNYIATVEELDDRGVYGEEIKTLLEIQDQDSFFDTDATLLSSLQPWRASKPVLHLKYEMQSSYSNEAFNEFRQLATVGLDTKNLKNVLFAEIECHDPLRPDQAPFYLAATVHLGAMSQDQDWCGDAGGKEYLVLECASKLYWHKSANDKNHIQSEFKYRGHDCRYQVNGDEIQVYFKYFGEWMLLIEGIVE
jgi:hypothetical protein